MNFDTSQDQNQYYSYVYMINRILKVNIQEV